MNTQSKWLLGVVSATILYLAYHGFLRIQEGAELGHRVPVLSAEVRTIHRKVNALMVRNGMNPDDFDGDGETQVSHK